MTAPIPPGAPVRDSGDPFAQQPQVAYYPSPSAQAAALEAIAEHIRTRSVEVRVQAGVIVLRRPEPAIAERIALGLHGLAIDAWFGSTLGTEMANVTGSLFGQWRVQIRIDRNDNQQLIARIRELTSWD